MIQDPARKPILIVGPTASGKSALALDLAGELGGVIINADSQQVYREWRVLTARPSVEDEAAAPHRLYGHVQITQNYSVGHWLSDIRTVLQECESSGQRPIIVGGTGLYFKALTQGLSPIPPIPPAIRAQATDKLESLGLPALAQLLASRDPATAAAIDLTNPRRVLRAWEVVEATGTGLAGWQARTGPPLCPLDCALAVALTPPRATLYRRCEDRFDAMLAVGALQEAAEVAALALPVDSPGMKAVGAAELIAHLHGEISLDEAITRAKTGTRRYAKRQLTWIRNQMKDWPVIETADPGLVLGMPEQPAGLL